MARAQLAAADFIFALTPSIWIRHWRVIRRFWKRKFGRIQSKHESVLDLLSLLRWSHAYDTHHLVRARQLIAERGRKMTVCRTFDELLATEAFDSQHCKN
jgi:hypothetical protein